MCKLFPHESDSMMHHANKLNTANLQLPRIWCIYWKFWSFCAYSFVRLLGQPKHEAILILLFAINGSCWCCSTAREYLDKKKQPTSWSPSASTHTHTPAVRPEKIEYTCGDSTPHIDSIYAYIPVWRLKSRDDETKTKTLKQKINALSLLRSIQCHRQAATAATVSRTPHIRTRTKVNSVLSW